jgi:hypothetical protein
MVELTALEIFKPSLVMKFAKMGVEMVDEGAPARLSNLVVELGLLAWIKVVRLEDPECTKIK